MMRCIIVDDEQLVRELLEDNIKQIPFLQLVKTCKNPLEAIEVLQTGQIDLIFLDIQMPRLNGLQFLQSLNNPPLVILVTAYEKYALEGFNLNVVDYILKPFGFDRFLKACNRANELFRLQQSNREAAGNEPEDFFVNVEYTLVKIVVADIDYIEGLKDYIKIHLSSAPKPVLTRMTIKAIEEKLPSAAFIRTHKSFLAAANKITTVKRDFVCIGEKEIPVSESYKENIIRILNRPEH
ncbi:LytTR family DNA-binding domain-containing protein [Mucilaginibacter sabulilitoris]|uniref:LytTR family DNA-binding domain-containing protein n=1 Tax=Mucilaginibacter sabulilitoris TaxID=1173583 RepID=A0ABZ0THM4_9SPHI|nr:LytTR family DNA-binding domain-containing protein [Mucilaginibacter sabulilitoris]WPU92696.1 LytTR family DNA-binding domain-containing protein [Mucilaginibacter sabulilitoris]